MTAHERRNLLQRLRGLRERAALDGHWEAFRLWDRQIRSMTEHGQTN